MSGSLHDESNETNQMFDNASHVLRLENTRFVFDQMLQLERCFRQDLPAESREPRLTKYEASDESGSWSPESEAEFAAAYELARGITGIRWFYGANMEWSFCFEADPREVTLYVYGPSRGLVVQTASGAFRVATRFSEATAALSPEAVEQPAAHAEPFRAIFIGHGGDPQWERLRDHLRDRGLAVEHYEARSRAGHHRTQVLGRMLAGCSMAFLVMTGEDVVEGEEIRARENVVHEVGLFQGRLGFHRAIVLLEAGVNEFSNIAGIGQIRFPKGRIEVAFEEVGDVIAREFPDVAQG